MKKFIFIVLICLILIGVSSDINISKAQKQTSDCQCITNAIADTQKIKIGTSRKDLMKMFQHDGGIYVETERFIYLGCSSIKVDVKFEHTRKGNNPGENSEDKVIEISKPYLEAPFLD